jgi:TatD DNase family protein
VIHSFSGSVDYARRVLDLGLAISISGLAFRAGEEATADVVPIVPADRLLVETDSPFLAPPGAPRSRNEPEWVRITASWVGELRGITEDELGDALVAAYDRTFPTAWRAAG